MSLSGVHCHRTVQRHRPQFNLARKGHAVTGSAGREQRSLAVEGKINPPKLGGIMCVRIGIPKKVLRRCQSAGRAERSGPDRAGNAEFLLSRVPPGLRSGRHGRTRGTRRVGDIYCFKLSPLLSSPCQEVFEDRKYGGDFVFGVNRSPWVAREFKARFPVQGLEWVLPGGLSPFVVPAGREEPWGA